MLHVRVVSPAEVTGPLIDMLTAASGVLNLVAPRGQRGMWRAWQRGTRSPEGSRPPAGSRRERR